MARSSVNLYATFLLTPLREGRREAEGIVRDVDVISTHAPAGGATAPMPLPPGRCGTFLLTPLREGRRV